MEKILASGSTIQNALPPYALMERQVGPQAIDIVKVEILLVGVESYCNYARATHSNHLKGNKEHFYIPKTECSYCQYNPQACRYCGFIFPTFSDRDDGHKLRNKHDCYYEICKEDHMKDYERPVGIKPVISTIPYRNTAAPQPPSKMDMLRNQAQQIAKQTSEKKQNAWTQRQNDTASSVPKKRVNALAKKQK